MRITESKQLRVEAFIGTNTPGISMLYEPEKRENKIAVIFVHGFRANTISTWGLQKDCYFWPVELGIATEASVYCVEYLNQWQARAPRAPLPVRHVNLLLIRDLRSIIEMNDRVVFITHSFGGVLVKDLYSFLTNSSDPGLSHLTRRIGGIYFLTCPHLGHYMAFSARFILGAIMSSNFNLLGSKHIRKINTDFLRDYDRNIGIITCRTHGETGYIAYIFRVGPEESMLRSDISHLNDERNHSTMCKSLCKKDRIFVEIASFVRLIAQQRPIDRRRLRAPLGE